MKQENGSAATDAGTPRPQSHQVTGTRDFIMKGVAGMKSTQLKSRKVSPKHRIIAAAALLSAAGLALTGCTGGGTTSPASNAAGGAGGEGLNITVMGGAADDPYWSTVKRGVEAAAKAVEASGGKVTFVSMPNYENFNADAAKLVSNMQAMNPDAVVIPNWAPQAQNENIKALTKEGVPVVFYSAGQDDIEATGAQLYVGTDDYIAGTVGGKAFAEAGAKNIVCVNTLPGTANQEARCQGVKDGAEKAGSSSSSLNLPSTQFGDPSAVTQAIKGAIVQDPTIDAVITIGVADSDSADAAIEQANARVKVKLGTFDVSSSGLERVKNGRQVFSIDQQPYAMGYYALSSAFQMAAYGITLPENKLLTGPSLITSENVDLALAGAKNGVR